ncbi:TolC family protein [Pedobacter metabolipauper]|uniref:Outer membrane protein TolC n=1 Tax=Pedobacter metabolipauper TaxID=425513 RepID=A0A4V3D0S1_9SPHI|nr:TolC family protein [Pedobacter metabolipauper]TDQ07098.1 outer membrane protein TolC [Pedobacter metabolipauper]
MPKLSLYTIVLYFFLSGAVSARAQTLNLRTAIETALKNYGTIKAKENYANASGEGIIQSRREYLPNFTLSAQQSFGTINGQNGPLAALGGNVASSGPGLSEQNWNAAFGALYLSNINWDFFTFGRAKQRINVSKAVFKRDTEDLEQEKFQHQIRVSAAYLNLVAAQRLTRSQKNNLERAIIFKNNATVRAANGLIAGVDSSLASAEVSSARIAFTKARDIEQEQANKLGILMGINVTELTVDTGSINHVPKLLSTADTSTDLSTHPVLKFYRDRVALSNEQMDYYKKLMYPTFTFIGVLQGRGSGFRADYLLNQNEFTRNYADGITPTRTNYLFGIGLSWNLTSILRNTPQVRAQRYISNGLENEYELVNQQFHAQLALADNKIKNAMANYLEAPVQVKAASDAYLQKSVLYKNGLTTIVDLTQALYTLNRAETDRDIAYTNVWQAVLLKSAALGDFNVFINEF